MLIRQVDQPGIVAGAASALAAEGINISFMSVGRTGPGKVRMPHTKKHIELACLLSSDCERSGVKCLQVVLRSGVRVPSRRIRHEPG